MGRNAEAEQHRATVAENDPAQVQAQFLRGLELGRAGKPAPPIHFHTNLLNLPLQPDLTTNWTITTAANPNAAAIDKQAPARGTQEQGFHGRTHLDQGIAQPASVASGQNA